MTIEQLVRSEIAVAEMRLHNLARRRAAGEASALCRPLRDLSEMLDALRPDIPPVLRADLARLDRVRAALFRAVVH